MDWYIAARTRHAEAVRTICDVLVSAGQIPFDWTTFATHDHREKTSAAGRMHDTIACSDVFVMISDAAGTDMLVELGIALASWKRTGKPCVYITGEHNRRSMMHFHPDVRHEDSLAAVLHKEDVEIPAETRELVSCL